MRTEIWLEQAIIFNPLLVAPDLSFTQAIASMSAARGTCSVLEPGETEGNVLQEDSRASCLLVVEKSQLVGILTERDVVRLSAEGQPLTNRTVADVMSRGVITLRKSEFTDIFVALHLLQRHHIRHLPLLDDQGQVIGLLTHETLRQLLRPADLLRLRLVSETMNSKVVVAAPETPVLHIAQLMTQHRVSSVVIVETQPPITEESELGHHLIPIGIVTEGDIVQFQALNLNFNQIQVRNVMSSPLFALHRQDSLWAAKSLMEEKRLSRVVVTGNYGELVGIVTQTTLLQTLNPLEMYNLVEVLEQKVCRLETEKQELLEKRNTELEQTVQLRTAELRKKNEREQLLSGIATRIRASLELQTILDTVVAEVQQFLQCDRVLVYQFNPDWSGIVTAEAVLPKWKPALGDTITDPCFQQKSYLLYGQGQKQAISNIYEAGYPQCYIDLLQTYQVKANLVVPILVDQQLWGLLIGHQCERPRLWEDPDLELLDRIAVQVAIAIQQSQAYEKAQREITERRQVEAALKQSEATKRAIILGIPDLLLRMNSQGEYQDFLSGAASQLVKKYKDLPNPSIWDLLPEPLATQRLHYTTLALASGEVQIYEQEIDRDGQRYQEEVRIVPLNEQEVLIIIRDITQRKQAEAAFQSLVEGAAAIAGENFFTELVQYIADVFKVRYVMVATQKDNTLQSAAFWLDGQVQPNLSCCIENTPCNLAVNLGEYICLSDVQQQFPTNQVLKTLNAESYVGIALRNTQGEIIGCLSIVDSKPITQPQLVLSMLRVFAARASAELERQTAIDALKQLNEQLEERIAQRTIELRQSEERFRQIFEQSPVGIAISDLEGQLTRVNSSLVEMMGYSEADLLQQSIQEILSVQGQQQITQQMEQLLDKTISASTFETKLVSGLGQSLWVNVTSALILNAFKQPAAQVHLVEDVTEQKQADQKLHRTLQELSDFKYALDQAAIVTITDAKGIITYANEQFCQISKYSCEELIGNTHSLIKSGYHSPEFFKQMWATINRGETWRGEIQNRAKDGTYYWVDMTVVPFLNHPGKSIQFLAICTDITARKQAEFHAESLKERLQFILSSSPAILYTCQPSSYKTTSVSENIKALLGYEPNELLQESSFWINLIHPQDHAKTLSEYSRVFQQKHLVLEYRVLHKNKIYRWMRDEMRLICDSQGHPVEIIGSITDITDHKQIELELQELTLSLQNAMEGISRLDKQGRYLSLNRAYAQPAGYEPQELVGMEWQKTVHPDDIPLLEAAYQTMLEQGKVEAEARGVRKDGSLFYKQVTMVTAVDQDGQFNGHYCFLKDITDRKAIEQALKRQLSAIEAAIDGIGIFEGDGYTYVNKAHLEMFGYTNADEFIGQSWTKLYTPEETNRIQREVFPVLMQQRYWQGEAIAIRKDGSSFHEGLSLTLAESGALICVCRDITEQKQAEAKIRQANDQLLLTNAELARATRLKDEFLANMSHELRTPLNAVLGMTEGLQEGVFGAINDRQKQAIQTIEGSGKHLLELINDILDLSKIESGKLELQMAPVSVNYLCQSSLTFVRQQAIKKNIQLTLEVPEHLFDIAVDERRIRQLLINLLNNAVKFTPERGSVKLVVQTEQQQDQLFLILSVIDTGIGIAQADMDKLFQSFVQIDSSLNRQYAGTGLGLSLVRRLAELHGGTVTVTSEVGRGSCFTVRLPYLALPSGSYTPQNQPSHGFSLPPDNLRVLIIEDSPASADQLTRYFSEVGMEAFVYSYGAGAIQEVLRINPALIILDIELPNVSGWTILNQLKVRPQTKDIPVVVASVVDERSRGLALGAAEYLVKPINRTQLHNVLKQLRSPQQSQGQKPPEQTKVAIASDLGGSPVVPQTVVTQTSSSPLILLAEDNEASILTISSYLKGRGYRLLIAKNGEEAITLAKTQHPDLILMDIQMPKVDGLEAIQQIRAEQSTIIPIIALTALAMPSDQEKCIAAGANEYMPKPVKLKPLVDKIQTLLVQTC